MCTARTERDATPRPAWGRLYGIVLVTVVPGLAVGATTRVGAMHHLLEVLVVIASFGGMLLWVRSNRVALNMAGTCDCEPERLQIRVVESRSARSRRRPQRELEIPVPLEASR